MKYLLIGDAGHKLDTAGKRTPRFLDGSQIREYEFNRPTVDKMLALAKKYGIETFDTAPENTEVSLKTRVDRANKAAKDFLAKYPDGVVLFVSVHYNAHLETWDGSLAEGIETFHMPGSVKGKALAEAVQSEIIKGTKQVNRGIKTANFYVLAYTTMPAVLCEFGFMDDPYEAKRMKDPTFQEECARELIDGVRKHLGLNTVPDAGAEVEALRKENETLKAEISKCKGALTQIAAIAQGV